MSNAHFLLVRAARLLDVNPFLVRCTAPATATMRLHDIDIEVTDVVTTNDVVAEFTYTGNCSYSTHGTGASSRSEATATSFSIKTSPLTVDDTAKLKGMIEHVCYKKLYSAPWVARSVINRLPDHIEVRDVLLVSKYAVDVYLAEKSKENNSGYLMLSIAAANDSDIEHYRYAVCDDEERIIDNLVRETSLEKAISSVTSIVETAFEKWRGQAKQPIDPSEVLYGLYQKLMKEASGDKERFRFERHSLKEFYILDNALDIRYALSLDPFTSSIMVYSQPLNEDSEHYKLVCMVDYRDTELQQKVADLTTNLPPF